MGWVSKEQIEAAKRVGLVDYLEAEEPWNLRKVSPNEYLLAEHDSLKISNNKWHWFSREIGGNGALDYLVKVREIGFVDAVMRLSEMQPGQDIGLDGFSSKAAWEARDTADDEKKFALKEANNAGMKAIRYLLKRGIDNEVISRCLREKVLYESKDHGNCVFVGYDIDKRPRYAMERGTLLGARYVRESAGSDKRYGFSAPVADGSCEIYVYESPIDALSHATICKMQGGKWDACNRLSLGGTSSKALWQYLGDRPHINEAVLCLDNDKAGIAAMRRIAGEIGNKPGGGIEVGVELPLAGKDWNDSLMALLVNGKKPAERAGNNR